ncbi:MAG: hypothetical protein BWK80_38075 [Desulfobacteraceae bacterium IS3]|nr:MAG: hypothetical protein BWK80_38075 [Desulfobacteraceae bacterium IS3]
MIDECSSARSCKEAAFDRFKDAFALYEKQRYLAVVYMAGYVIELGIKSEFHKLKNFQLTEINYKAKDIVQDLFKGYFTDNKLPDWIKNFAFPLTLFDFLSFISNIADLTPEKSEKPLLKNYIKKSNAFSVVLSNRQLPDKDVSSKFHDISGFLSELNDWRKRVGEPTFSIEDYEIENLGWGINLRYAGSVNTMNDEDAKKALLMVIKFLKEILLIDISEYENKIDPTNYQQPIDIEERY